MNRAALAAAAILALALAAISSAHLLVPASRPSLAVACAACMTDSECEACESDYYSTR